MTLATITFDESVNHGSSFHFDLNSHRVRSRRERGHLLSNLNMVAELAYDASRSLRSRRISGRGYASPHLCQEQQDRRSVSGGYCPGEERVSISVTRRVTRINLKEYRAYSPSG